MVYNKGVAQVKGGKPNHGLQKVAPTKPGQLKDGAPKKQHEHQAEQRQASSGAKKGGGAAERTPPKPKKK